MSISRGFYIASYTAFLVSISASLALLLTYTNTPFWVWSFYGIAILILIFLLFIKEAFLKNGAIKTLYGIGSLIAVALLFAGIGFTIVYSSIPAWVWIVLAISLTFSIASTTVLGIWPTQQILSTILSVSGMVLFVVGIAGAALSANLPWWVWLTFFFTVSLGLITHYTEINSKPRYTRPNEMYTRTKIYPRFETTTYINQTIDRTTSILTDQAGNVLSNDMPISNFVVTDQAGNIVR